MSRCPVGVRALVAVVSGLGLLSAAMPAGAFPAILNAWQARYGAISPSGDNARCQLCHANTNGGSPWNAYGWDLDLALADAACDANGNGTVSNDEAFFCVELLDSDQDGSATNNVDEIGLGTQPGWRLGATNTLFSDAGTTPGAPPPGNIGPIDPDGTEPPPPPPPPPPGDETPPGRLRWVQLVKPGESIQKAIDAAKPGGVVFVLPGVYRELADRTNGLNISKSIRLVGLSSKKRRVVLQNAGNQRNGIVAVPAERTDCMGCHESMAPPFPLRDGVAPGMKDQEPVIYGLHISGITIDGFTNNGLFTERVDGFRIEDVESVGNKNYGIFPTLSRNGVVTRSRASGADDSGIWIETSQNVQVTHNVVEGNVNGFELSNSDDVLFAYNDVRHNTVGFAVLLLPDIYDERPGAKRITVRDNWIHENNKPNTARPGSVLAEVPAGTGILLLGVDDSRIENNRIENNAFGGIAIADYCLTVLLTPFSCIVDPGPPGFVEDAVPQHNRVVGNALVNNGNDADPAHPFAFAASDLVLLTYEDEGNCYARNAFTTFLSTFGLLPECPSPPVPVLPRGKWRR